MSERYIVDRSTSGFAEVFVGDECRVNIWLVEEDKYMFLYDKLDGETTVQFPTFVSPMRLMKNLLTLV